MIPDAIVLKIMVNHPNISTSFLEEHKYDKDIKDEVVAEIAIVLRRMSEK